MELFVPGRVCLFGEHSDWAGGYRRLNPELEKGYTLICGTDQGIYARVTPHPGALVLTAATPEGKILGPHEIPMEAEALLVEAESGGFWSYIAGVAYQALIHYQVDGLQIHNHRTDLPIKKGLSSSAAICVLAARAFNRLYDLKLTTRGEMELAYLGEVTTPSRCGRMDQGCAFGNRPVLMTFDGDRLATKELEAGQDLHFVIVDLLAEKDTMEILARLNSCFPCATDEISRGVQDLLGPVNKAIVHEAAAALEAGNARELGRLMTEAQVFFDRYASPACPEELTAPALHRVLRTSLLKPHIWGGKGVGSQGDGAAQLVARSESDQQAIVEILQRDLGLPGFKVTLRSALQPQPQEMPGATVEIRRASTTTQPSHRVRKAVVPAAGLGTRLFPATRAIKKEFFPIIDHDGLAKPAVLLIVEEALAAGIEEVIVVVQPQDLGTFQAFFNGSGPADNHDGYPPPLREYARRILEMGLHVKPIVQSEQAGFGHAVYCAREAVAGEPFLLMLGDHLYRSDGERPCARQLIDAHERSGKNIIGLRRVPEGEIAHYGTASGRWLEDSRLLEIDTLAEKPDVSHARAHLRMPGLPDGQYLAFFGQYVLKPELFEYLAQQIAGEMRERGEYQLTSALDQLRQDADLWGLEVEGQCYDIGLPDLYLRTLLALGPKPGD